MSTDSAPQTASADRRGAEQLDSDGYRPGYEVIAEQILEFIATRGLRPGDRLPTEAQLAQELGTSRSVTREAVKILSALGRVRAHRGRGLFVADDPGLPGATKTETPFFLPGDIDHVTMLFEFRRIQEVEISRLAAQRATPPQLRAITEAVETCRDGVRHDDGALFSKGDAAFHLAVAEAAHNPFLTEALLTARRLQHQSNIIGLHGQASSRIVEAAEEHAAIYEAIRDGHPDNAAQAAANHVDRSLEDYRLEIRRRLFG